MVSSRKIFLVLALSLLSLSLLSSKFSAARGDQAFPWDINGDSVVDLLDMMILSKAYGANSSSSNWNPKADVDGNGLVDICDSIAVSAHFGEKISDEENSSVQAMRYAIGTYSWTAQDYATRTDGLQAHFDYPPYTLQQISLQRSNFTCFLYRNAREVYSSSDEFNTFVSNGWLLKNETGNYVKRGSNYYADIGNSAYQQWLANWCYTHLETNFNAVFLDNGLYPTEGNWHYGASGEPINPRTNMPFTDDQVVNAYISAYRAIKAKVGSNMLVVANGIYTGARWMRWGVKDNYIKLVNELDGFMIEGWLSTWVANGVNYYEETYAQNTNYNWKDSVDMLVEINNLFSGKHIIISAHNADDQDEWAPRFYSTLTTTEEKEQYCLFNYASMLLAISSNNTYWLALGWWGLTNMQNLFATDIGTPLGHYHKNAAGVYVREFTKCTVYVNPSTEDRGGMKSHTAKITMNS